MKLKHLLPIAWLVVSMGMSQGMQAQTKATNEEITEVVHDNNHYTNGQIMSEWTRENWKKVGDWIYYNEDGSVNSQWLYVGGKVEWHRLYYYQDGQVLMEWSYKNGKKDGLWVEYYENGGIASEWRYVQDKEEWVFTDYYPTKQVKSVGQYNKWIEQGEFYWYDVQGKVIETVSYQDGRIVK